MTLGLVRGEFMIFDITLDPTILSLGPLQIGWHGLFTMLAVVVALWYGLQRADRADLPVDIIEQGLSAAIIGGFVGARLFHVFDHLDFYSQNPLEILYIWQGGMAAYGGFVGGLTAGIVYARRVGLPVWRLLDATAPALIVGQIIGRLGCLSNGDAWGAPTEAGYGVVYWNEHASIPAYLLGVPTHPYPLYEMIVLAGMLGGLLTLAPRMRASGQLFLLTVLGYSIVRFLLTFVRQEPIVIAGLQEAQVVAAITGIIVMALLPTRRPAARPMAGVPLE
jgi:phosphatidylglycerol---prolipoprotein diacylglyceryl transferase